MYRSRPDAFSSLKLVRLSITHIHCPFHAADGTIADATVDGKHCVVAAKLAASLHGIARKLL
jgi:hypothetical protein